MLWMCSLVINFMIFTLFKLCTLFVMTHEHVCMCSVSHLNIIVYIIIFTDVGVMVMFPSSYASGLNRSRVVSCVVFTNAFCTY